MKRLVPSILVATLLLTIAAAPAGANIGAKTTVTYKRGSLPVNEQGYYYTGSKTLLGHDLDYSFGDAFVNGLVLAYRIYSLYSGIKYIVAVPAGTTASEYANHGLELLKEGRIEDVASLVGGGMVPLSTVSFFQSAIDFFDSLGAQLAGGSRWLHVRKSANYDKVVVSFAVWSNEDPFGTFRAAPLYEQPGITVTQHVTQWKNGHPSRGELRVTLDTRVLPAGVHPISFRAKQTGWWATLGVTHDIIVSLSDATCSGRSPSCNIYDSWIRWYEGQIDNTRRELYAVLESDDAGIVAAVASWKKSFEICGHRGAPGTALFDQCIDDADGPWYHRCPDIAFGASDSACSRLRDLENYLAWAQDQVTKLQQTSYSAGCMCSTSNSTHAY